jgi:hypothetical protein
VTCADCSLAKGVSFPVSSPPQAVLVNQGYQTMAGFTLERGLVHANTRVDQVDPDSPAYRAGLRHGDVITKVNGKDVRSTDDLDRYLGGLEGRPRGETWVTLEVFRPQTGEAGGGEDMEFTFRPRSLPLYPTQLYEAISMALVMLLLWAYEPFRRNPGQVGAVLMVCYGIHRFLNEILRDDPRPIGFERYGSLLLVAGGVALWVWLQWYKKPDEPVAPVGDAAKALGLAPAPERTEQARSTPSEAIRGAPPVTPGP